MLNKMNISLIVNSSKVYTIKIHMTLFYMLLTHKCQCKFSMQNRFFYHVIFHGSIKNRIFRAWSWFKVCFGVQCCCCFFQFNIIIIHVIQYVVLHAWNLIHICACTYDVHYYLFLRTFLLMFLFISWIALWSVMCVVWRSLEMHRWFY